MAANAYTNHNHIKTPPPQIEIRMSTVICLLFGSCHKGQYFLYGVTLNITNGIHKPLLDIRPTCYRWPTKFGKLHIRLLFICNIKTTLVFAWGRYMCVIIEHIFFLFYDKISCSHKKYFLRIGSYINFNQFINSLLYMLYLIEYRKLVLWHVAFTKIREKSVTLK